MTLEFLSPLHKASRQLSVYLETRTREAGGVSPVEGHILSYLRGYAPAPVGELVRVFGIKQSTLTSMLDRLERAGLVRRETNRDDRRSFLVHITADGLALAERMNLGLEALENEIRSRVSARDVDGFHAVDARRRGDHPRAATGPAGRREPAYFAFSISSMTCRARSSSGCAGPRRAVTSTRVLVGALRPEPNADVHEPLLSAQLPPAAAKGTVALLNDLHLDERRPNPDGHIGNRSWNDPARPRFLRGSGRCRWCRWRCRSRPPPGPRDPLQRRDSARGLPRAELPNA